MDVLWPIVGLLLVAGIVVMMRVWSAHTVVRIAEGRARVVRGTPPRPLVHDLDEVARCAPDAAGWVEVRGKGSDLTLRVHGLGEHVGQRVRNVVLLYRNRLG